MDNLTLIYITSPCNSRPPGLHPEVIAFFDLKSQNKNCFWLRAETFSLIANSLVRPVTAELLRRGAKCWHGFRCCKICDRTFCTQVALRLPVLQWICKGQAATNLSGKEAARIAIRVHTCPIPGS